MTVPARLPEPDHVPDNVRQLRPAARRFAEWPMSVVSALMLLSLAVVASDHFRRGAVLFSASMVLAFFLRLLLSDRDAGILMVRSRRVDLTVLALLALAVSALSFVVPPPS